VPYYDLLRGLHIIAVIAWMAAFLILPRLFIYQMQADQGSKMERVLIDAQARLFRIVMNPSMIAAWIFGLALLHHDVSVRGWQVLLEPWLVTKLLLVLALTAWHGVLSGARRRFASGTNTRSERYWRMVNELPFVAAIVMVLSVTTEWRLP
jgi:protoporphyrinogen IX oxidase